MMLNKKLRNEALPKSNRVYLCLPGIEESAEFLSASEDSIDFHYPWIEAPSSEEKYKKYIQRINFELHLGFFVRQKSDKRLFRVLCI